MCFIVYIYIYIYIYVCVCVCIQRVVFYFILLLYCNFSRLVLFIYDVTRSSFLATWHWRIWQKWHYQTQRNTLRHDLFTLKICCNLSIEQYYWYQIIPAPHKTARIDTDPLSTKQRQSTLLEKVCKPRDWSYRFEIGHATLNLYFVPLEFLDFFLRLTNWSYDVYSTCHK